MSPWKAIYQHLQDPGDVRCKVGHAVPCHKLVPHRPGCPMFCKLKSKLKPTLHFPPYFSLLLHNTTSLWESTTRSFSLPYSGSQGLPSCGTHISLLPGLLVTAAILASVHTTDLAFPKLLWFLLLPRLCTNCSLCSEYLPNRSAW